MANCYLATAQRGTAVSFCLTGNFIRQSDVNLLVAKNNHLEVYSLCPEGLRLLTDINVYGQICCCKAFKSPSLDGKDWIFIVTAKYHAMILECEVSDGEKFEIVTRAFGNVSERVGRPREDGILCTIDPSSRNIGLQIYDGYFKLLPIEKDNKELKAFNMRIEEM